MAGLLGLDDDMRLALMTAGLGTLAGRGGPMRAAGQGGLLGVASYQNSKRDKADARRQELEEERIRLQIQMQQESLAQAQRAAQQADAKRAAYSAAVGGAMIPGSPGRPAGLGDVDSGMDAGMQPAMAPRAPGFDYGRFAEGIRDVDPMAAMEAIGKAQPKEKKLKDTRTLMRNGQRVTVNFYDDGSHEILPYSPDAEKAHFANTGGAIMPLDPFTGSPVGQGIKATMTPGEGARLGLSREEFTYRKGRDVAEDAAKAKAGGADGGKITESQGTAAVYLSMMGEANKTLEKLGGKDAPFAGTVSLAKSPAMGWAASGAGKAVAAAQMQWVEAALRITTGATAPPEEIVRMTRMYFPQIGDDTQTVKQKNAARSAFESGVRIKAGAGGPAADRGVAAVGGGGSGGLTPAEQTELDALKKRFGR
jgi:hypothetical protein